MSTSVACQNTSKPPNAARAEEVSDIMIKITHCPTCGSRKIRKVRRNLTRDFRGQTYVVPDLEFHECPNCGEKLYDREAMRKIEAHSPAFAKARSRKQARVA